MPSNLVGLCFKYLANDHVKANCTVPAICFHYKCEGHQARHCPIPWHRIGCSGTRSVVAPRRVRLVAGVQPLGGEPRLDSNRLPTTTLRPVALSPPGVPPRCHGVVRRPPRARVPRVLCLKPLHRFPAPAAAPRRFTELVVVPRSAELQAAEQALSLALVTVVGGTRPPVSPEMVGQHQFQAFGVPVDRVSVRRHTPEDFIV